MSQQYSTDVRNGMLQGWADNIGALCIVQIFSGAPPANCAAADTGTKLWEFVCDATPFSVPAAGAISLADLPLAAAAIAGAPTNAGHYRIKDATGAVCHEQGTITATGGGGDMTLDNVSIATGQTVQITGYTKTAPGA